jgi:hypothetical protein
MSIRSVHPVRTALKLVLVAARGPGGQQWAAAAVPATTLTVGTLMVGTLMVGTRQAALFYPGRHRTADGTPLPFRGIPRWHSRAVISVATLADQLPRFADRKDPSGPYRLPRILSAR